MSVRGRRSIIIGIVGCAALGVLVVATRGHAAPPSPAALYSYPPNLRQLIAAGLTGRPVGQNLSGPVTIDLLLVDGVQTTVLFHVAGGRAAVPFLTLSDDHSRIYQPRSTSMGGLGFAVLPRPMGWRGILWDLLRLVPFLGAGQPARGYTIFASLPPTVHTATVRIVSAGNVQAVRIPLHLAALRTLTRTLVFRRPISRHGMVVTLQRVSRGPGSAALVYTIDAPALASGPPDGVLRDARGHQVIPTGASGTRRVPQGRAARMHCEQTIVIAPPAPGTPLRLIVTPRPSSGRGLPAGSGIVMSFRMPEERGLNMSVPCVRWCGACGGDA
jgi:hypothetical protein